MSHFYGYLQGHRGEATRCGSANSGITSTIKSWQNIATCSFRKHEDEGGKDKDQLNINAEHIESYSGYKPMVVSIRLPSDCEGRIIIGNHEIDLTEFNVIKNI